MIYKTKVCTCCNASFCPDDEETICTECSIENKALDTIKTVIDNNRKIRKSKKLKGGK